jgi:hypothetical protein
VCRSRILKTDLLRLIPPPLKSIPGPGPQFTAFRGSFPRIKWGVREVDYSVPSSVEVKNESAPP